MDRETIRRRRLPHWDVPCAAYFVTTCLEGSIPAEGLLDIEGYRTELSRQQRPAHVSKAAWDLQNWKRSFARTDEWLDLASAVRHLADPRLAKAVADALYFFAGQRYDLLSYVAMPSHIHWVFQPLELWVSSLVTETPTPRERILHSVNRHSAFQCNKLLNRTGAFWQHESYDHWVRDADELERIILYIEGNPVKAGFVDSPEKWLYSSARDRKDIGIEFGSALRRPS